MGKRGLNVSELARELGVSRGTVHRWIQNRLIFRDYEARTIGGRRYWYEVDRRPNSGSGEELAEKP